MVIQLVTTITVINNMDFNDTNNLLKAFHDCKTDTTWKRSVQLYEINLLANVCKSYNDVLNGTYKQLPFYEFNINERGKKRHIKALHISDRVVQRSLCDNVLLPNIKPYLIYDNGASMRGKGLDFSRNRLKTHLHKYFRKHGNNGYVLLIDFSKFFDSIPHDKLLEMLSLHIGKEELALCGELIRKFEINGDGNISVGIGSQLSQVAGIYFPHRLDNFAKIVKGEKFYGRYMDDVYVIHESKEHLKQFLQEYKAEAEKYGIKINDKKTQITRVSSFSYLKMKYTLTEKGKVFEKMSNETFRRMRRKIKRFKRKVDCGEMSKEDVDNSFRSWYGSAEKYGNHYRLEKIKNYKDEIFGENNDRRNQKQN